MLLGRLLTTGRGGPENQVLAAHLFDRACAAGDLDGCARLGQALLIGVGTRLDISCGTALLERTCEQGGGLACTELGQRTREGNRVAFDERVGVRLLERGCEAGTFEACRDLAEALDGKEPEAASLAFAKAARTALGGCADVNPEACEALLDAVVQNHGRLTDELVKVPEAERDRARLRGCERSLEIRPDFCHDEGLAAACTAGDYAACLAKVSESADGDAPRSRPTFQKICAGGVEPACERLADDDPALERACAKGALAACVPHRAGEGWDKDRSTEKREAGCAAGLAIDCRKLAEASADEGRVVDLLGRACPDARWRTDELDRDARACKLLGDRFRKGQGVAVDAARATELYRRACWTLSSFEKLGEGCAELAEVLNEGEGIERDPARSLDTLRGYCTVNQLGCDLLKERTHKDPFARVTP